MTKKTNWLLISLLASIATFTYLAWHHYSIKLGLGDSSLCSISSKYNCEAAATSSFSEIFQIPVAIMGAVFHSVLFLFILSFKLGWIETSTYLQKTVRSLVGIALITSLVMGAISVFLIKVICPFCTLTYLFSLINFILAWNLIPHSKDTFKLNTYLSEYRAYVISVLLIPVFSWAINGMVQESYGLTEFRKNIPFWIANWKNSPQIEFSNDVGLASGPTQAKMTIVEFADFKCPHCKSASTSINAFLQGKSNIRFIYKPYPLDGTCNSNVNQKLDGTRCSMAAFTLCAQKLKSNGWDVHHWLFEQQQDFFSVTDSKKILESVASKFNFNMDELEKCANSSDIYNQINMSVEEGNRAKIEGTPAIFVNGKKLTYGQHIELLKEVYKY